MTEIRKNYRNNCSSYWWVFEEPVTPSQMIPGVYALTETFRSSVLSCFPRSLSLKGAFQSMIPYVGRMWRSDRKGERKRGIALGFRLWRSDKKRERQRERQRERERERERERLHASASPFGPNTSSATTPITNTSGAPTPSNEACTPVFLTCVPLTTHTHIEKKHPMGQRDQQ